MTPSRPDSLSAKLVRLGLPLLAAGALLVALGAVVSAHQRVSAHAVDGDTATTLAALDDRLAAHQSKRADLAAFDIDRVLAASRDVDRAAERAAASSRPEPRPRPRPRPVDDRPDPDHGVIVLDCDVDSPLGCMDD